MQPEGFSSTPRKVFLMKKFIIFTVDIQRLRESRSNVKCPHWKVFLLNTAFVQSNDSHAFLAFLGTTCISEYQDDFDHLKMTYR